MRRVVMLRYCSQSWRTFLRRQKWLNWEGLDNSLKGRETQQGRRKIESSSRLERCFPKQGVSFDNNNGNR